CSAAVVRSSAITSATTWPEPAEASVWAKQPLCAVAQPLLELVVPVATGGPRAPPAPLSAVGPTLPVTEVRAVPAHPVPPLQSRTAEAIVQLDAPGTVGPPEFALEPGAVEPGGKPCRGASGLRSSAPISSSETSAFDVDAACTSGRMVFASGPDEAPEFVTAWQRPPVTASQEPVLRDPRGSADTDGSVAVAALDACPSQTRSPAQATTAPAAEAAGGPGTSRAALTGCPPEKASAAPDPVEANELDAAWQPAVPPAQLASPADVRGTPPATAPSHAEVEVRTEPEQASEAQTTVPDDDATEDGPLVGCPGSGRPVTGSTATKSGADDADEVVVPAQAPPVTVHSAVAFVPRACGDTAVSRALVADSAVPSQVPAPPAHSTHDSAVDTLTGPDTGATPGIASPVAGSRSVTEVADELAQPPSPWTVQLASPVLSRMPATSPVAAPVVRTRADPVQVVASQSAAASAVLDAESSRRGCPNASAVVSSA